VTVTRTGGGGTVEEVTIKEHGSDYAEDEGYDTTGGHGYRVCKIDITGVGGVITGVTLHDEGVGYTTGVVPLQVVGDGHGASVSVTTIDNNIMSVDFNDKLFTVLAGVTDHTFSITVPNKFADHTDLDFGGNDMTVTKLAGRQMQEIWKSFDLSDTEVRTTTAGSVPYNFILKRLNGDPTKAALCYDVTNPSASFVTINAGCPEGTGNIFSSWETVLLP